MQPIAVAGSPESGYRMRARFHVHGSRVGFYREGTHTLCEPQVTGQLRDGALDSVNAAVTALTNDGYNVVSVELTEDVAGSQRALSATIDGGRGGQPRALERVVGAGGLRGCTVRNQTKRIGDVGEPYVSDALNDLTRGRAAGSDLRRHAESFFQANRFLVPDLVAAVIDSVQPEGSILDLYAGVGLFAVALDAQGRDVTAVEGDPSSGADLQHNAGALASGGSGLTVTAGQRRGVSRGSIPPGYPDRRSTADGHLARSDDVSGEDSSCEDRLRLVRSRDHGARRETVARRRLCPDVAARVRSLSQHTTHRVAWGI